MNKQLHFKCSQPCNNCPYRTDAPLQLWHKSEYEKLLQMEQAQFGAVYGCHKNNGSICIGWLMKQDENNFPSIALRISLSKNNITREYLDGLHSPAPLYKSVKDMIKANYPRLKTGRREKQNKNHLKTK
jgi:hypothetical protein